MDTLSLHLKKIAIAGLTLSVGLLLAACDGNKNSGAAPAPPGVGRPRPQSTPTPPRRTPRPPQHDNDEDGPGVGRGDAPFDDDEDAVEGDDADNIPGGDQGEPDPTARASRDRAYSQILHVIESQEREDADADIEFAQKLGGAMIDIDWSTGRGKIKLKPEGGDELEYEGRVDDKLRFVPVKDTVDGVKISTECLDREIFNRCETLHVVISKEDREAHILHRDTAAEIFISGNEIGRFRNPDYDRLMKTFVNTVERRGGGNRVQRLRVVTTEVVGGPNAIVIAMVMGNLDSRSNEVRREALVWGGPLHKFEGSDRVNYPLELVKAPSAQGPRSPFAEVIQQTRLIRNNGKGDVKIKIVVKKPDASGARADAIRLTLARKFSSVREPSL